MFQALVTVDDFKDICRVCLQSHEDMVDIFGSGMDNQLMKITKLKVSSDDKLPKTLCQNCRIQIEYLSKFLEKATSSDIYLRSLVSGSENNNVENEEKEEKDKEKEKEEKEEKEDDNDKEDSDQDKKSQVEKSKSHKMKLSRSKSKVLSKKSKNIKRAKKDVKNNKMYLIVVPEADDDSQAENEICIKDLSIDNNNLELMHFCKNLVTNYYVDHTYPKECKNIKEIESLRDQQESYKEADRTFKYIYNVNLVIFECTQCEESFEEYYDLSSHCLFAHKSELPFVQFFYICPVCKYGENDKYNFLNHLEFHKKTEGFQFLKVNSLGEPVPLRDLEKHIFLNSTLGINSYCKVLKLNLDMFSCTTCFQKVELKDDITEHIKSYHADEQFNGNYCIRYVCPICDFLFIDDKKNFCHHLISHNKENIYFIKVDSTGQPLELKEDYDVFLSYEQASQLVKVLDEPTKIFKVTNVNSCDKCDYASESFLSLSDHYSTKHSEKILPELSQSCPVCFEEYKSSEVDETKEKLYEHLKIHKDEGIHFVEVNKNGSISNCSEKYSSIFTQSLLLYSLLNGSLSTEFDQVWCPDMVIFSSDNSPSEEDDLWQSQLKNNKEVGDLKFQNEIKTNHEKLNYVCEKCGKTFAGKGNYQKHFLKHSKMYEGNGKRPVCTVCHKTFANRTSLCSHMRHHMEEETGNEREKSLLGIICDKCGRSFTNHTSLMKHKKVHRSYKKNSVLKCEICSREFFRQSSFDRHKSAHLNLKYFDCDVCKLPLSSMGSLQKHSELHKNGGNTYDCSACNTSFLTKDSLTAHQTHTGHYMDRKPLECNVCHEKFFIGRKFTEHIKTHPKYKMGECSLCGKRLSTVQSLMLHMGRHFESNSILCPHCGKQFFEERNYNRHLLTHEGIKPFACDVDGCGKSFYTLFELNRHKKYHSNTRDFGCPYCGKSFHEANHLTVHVRTHTGERPYVCPHCNKGFITRTRCKHHIKLVHQGVGYDLIQSSISKKVAVFEAVEAV